jgi:hypothetical protein
MTVSNFWTEAKIDGRGTPLSGGPRSADGGFSEVIYVRDRGDSRKALTVFGEVDGELLTLRVLDEEGQEVYRVEARR